MPYYSGPSIDILKSLPPEALKVIPLAQPPPGVKANFENPPTRVPVILGVSSTYLVIATICLGIRTHTKIVIAKKWGWDDTLAVLGFVISIVYFSSVVIGCLGGVVGRHAWDIHLDGALGHDSLVQNYIVTIMSNPALGLIKMSFLIQYYYLFGVMRYVRISVYIVGILIAIFYVSMSTTAFVLTSPWPGECLLDAILSQRYQKFANFAIPAGVIGMLFDWTLLFLPMPAVWHLHVSRKQKLGVILIFMTGTLGVVASVISLYYRVLQQNHPNDTMWRLGYTLLWTQVWMWSGITASCMPSIKQFYSHYKPSSETSIKKISIAHLQQLTGEKVSKSNRTFGKWGYESNAVECLESQA